MMLGTSQLTPPFVQRENVAGLLKLMPITFSGLMRVTTGLSTRSQTRYMKFEFTGSAVIASLSFRIRGLVSLMIVTCSLHVTPPSWDLLTSRALFPMAPGKPGGASKSNDRLTWKRSPFGAKESHGSDPRL